MRSERRCQVEQNRVQPCWETSHPCRPVPDDRRAGHGSGIATSALRFYEDRGLIRAYRTRSGHRRYSRSVLRRIAFIVFAQRVGLTLKEVATELAKLPGNGVPDRSDWAKLSRDWSRRIDERIADLERVRAGLTSCIG